MFTKQQEQMECKQEFLELCPVPSNFIAPEVETWKGKISKNSNTDLCSKFVPSKCLATEHISNKKCRQASHEVTEINKQQMINQHRDSRNSRFHLY